MTSNLTNLQIAEEAADWAIRLDCGPLDATERGQLAKWLLMSPIHVGELLQSCALLAGVGLVSKDNTQAIETLLAEIAPEVVPLFRDDADAGAPDAAEEAPPEATRPIGKAAFPRTLAYAASVAFVAALALAIVLLSPDRRPSAGSASLQIANSYVTGVGEQRTISLEDGSVISMNTDSRIEVAFTSEARQVELPSGEAMFTVAHDPARPFRVHASGTLVQAVGTKFIVKHVPQGIHVVVLEGKVILNANSGADGTASPGLGSGGDQTARFLVGGQAVTVDSARRLSAVAAADVPRATAWRERRLAFDNETLFAIVAEFNRYNRTKLEVRGADLAETRLSGVFEADDPNSFVAFLEFSAAVRVDRSEAGKVILAPAP